jgi:2-C-methyl-D-erythritol 4-phosphate cytidylyltransferase
VTVWAVVVAAGGGSRFGGLKQFEDLGGRAVVDWSVEAARSVADGVVLVLSDEVATDPSTDSYGADIIAIGGANRSASVAAGVRAVPAEAEVIVVHDGARPLASGALFRAVVGAVRAGADGAVPGLALADTVKQVDDGATVMSTVERRGLMSVQTPQAFRADLLRQAHEAGFEATDDAGLVEAQGATVRVVPGDPRNLKVTTPADLDMARVLAGV